MSANGEPWFVWDPITSTLYGAFVSADAASDYANLLYPEDGSGQCLVVQVVAP